MKTRIQLLDKFLACMILGASISIIANYVYQRHDDWHFQSSSDRNPVRESLSALPWH